MNKKRSRRSYCRYCGQAVFDRANHYSECEGLQDLCDMDEGSQTESDYHFEDTEIEKVWCQLCNKAATPLHFASQGHLNKCVVQNLEQQVFKRARLEKAQPSIRPPLNEANECQVRKSCCWFLSTYKLALELSIVRTTSFNS